MVDASDDVSFADLPPALRAAILDDPSFRQAGVPQLTAFSATGAPTVWDAMCQKMLGDIHRNHCMAPETKEAMLRPLQLTIPGEPAGREVALLEDPSGVFSVGATGAVLWPAAVALISKLDKIVAETVHCGRKPPRVVELGAGLGAVGMFLAQHRGCSVVLTELMEAVPLLIRNVAANFNDHAPEVMPLSWGDKDQLRVITLTGHYDLVIGSDVSYRPEFLEELITTADDLLEADGRVWLSLQDRPQEAKRLEAAVASSTLKIISHEVVPLPRIDSETDAGNRDMQLIEHEPGEQRLAENDVVHLFELVRRERAALSNADEVEAEFERITGIRPDPVEGITARPQIQTEKTQAPEKTIREKLVTDFLRLGLGEKLFDVDDSLKAAMMARTDADRPRTNIQRRQFAEAYYAGTEWKAPATNALLDSMSAWGDGPAGMAEIFGAQGRHDEAVAAVSAQEQDAKLKDRQPSEANGIGKNCQAIVCLQGLEWQLHKGEKDGMIEVIVTFDEEVWRSLSGSSSVDSFRSAVGFELAENEMRVMHVGTCVLHLQFLEEAVDTTKAVAKLSSRSRRVTVRAPSR